MMTDQAIELIAGAAILLCFLAVVGDASRP
jgi:hypothetical protein